MSHHNLTAPGRRHRAVAALQVWLSRSETSEWGADPTFRTALLADMSRRARERGRRMVEIYDARGARLHAAPVGATSVAP